jgi:hypothetical protein
LAAAGSIGIIPYVRFHDLVVIDRIMSKRIYQPFYLLRARQPDITIFSLYQAEWSAAYIELSSFIACASEDVTVDRPKHYAGHSL